ncbi:MAG: hypothetical protein JSV78_13845 [Phycisphaerales bacterium]|nr:MAG: hypothetical protein JSV78_13845 [Phycisphaerales bacterium]
MRRMLRGSVCCWAAAVIFVCAGCASFRIEADPVYFPKPPTQARVVHIKSFNSLYDLVEPSLSFAERLRGAVSPYVSVPAGIAYGAGHVYVCDVGLNVVHDWDLSTGRGRRLGEEGECTLSKPVAVAVGEDGTVYVADTGLSAVAVFDVEGNLTRTIKVPDREAYRPVAVAVREGKLYVADVANHCVDVISTADDSLVAVLDGTGSETGRLHYPTGVATCTKGNIYVSEMLNARVQVFNTEHKAVLSMGGLGDRYGDMGKPKHLSVGADGVIFIADAEFAHIHLFNEQGQLLMLLGGPKDGPGGTPMPMGVAVAEELPEGIRQLVPADFEAKYFLFATNTVGSHRLSLFAVGTGR